MAETSEILEKRRKKLAFRSWHRGTREMDLLIGGFADAHLPVFDSAQLDAFEELLGQNDLDLYAWMAGRRPPPAALNNPVLSLLLNFKHSA